MIPLRSVLAKLIVAALLLSITLPIAASAHPFHGRGHQKKARQAIYYRDDCRGCWDKHGRWRGRNKKAEKFINGHDARDGRWDGRGPRPNFRRLPPPRRWYR